MEWKKVKFHDISQVCTEKSVNSKIFAKYYQINQIFFHQDRNIDINDLNKVADSLAETVQIR